MECGKRGNRLSTALPSGSQSMLITAELYRALRLIIDNLVYIGKTLMRINKNDFDVLLVDICNEMR
jgi:hypothetical protein